MSDVCTPAELELSPEELERVVGGKDALGILPTREGARGVSSDQSKLGQKNLSNAASQDLMTNPFGGGH
jgi:hypothetical protein